MTGMGNTAVKIKPPARNETAAPSASCPAVNGTEQAASTPELPGRAKGPAEASGAGGTATLRGG